MPLLSRLFALYMVWYGEGPSRQVVGIGLIEGKKAVLLRRAFIFACAWEMIDPDEQ